MHIAEGIMSAPVLIGGAALTAAGLARGLRAIDADNLPRVGLMSAALLVASLIHVPIGPSSAHLILNGLAGLLLGWAVFPALLVALLLEAILFQFGGLTTLGVNTAIMACPAIACHLLFGRLIWRRDWTGKAAAFAAGALAVALAGVLLATSLYLSGQGFEKAAILVLAIHGPMMVIEGLICTLCVSFLRTVKPAMLPGAKQQLETERAA